MIRHASSLLAASLACACAIESPFNAPEPVDAGRIHTPAADSGNTEPPHMIMNSFDAGNVLTPIPSGLNPEVILASGCATWMERSSLLPSNLLFVVDRSGSMLCNPPPTTSSEACEISEQRADLATPSKWELTTHALLISLATLPESTFVGLSYFSNDSHCGVARQPYVSLSRNTPAQRSTIASSLAVIMPGGSTPLVGATILAYNYLHDAAVSGDRYVVLITDGQQSEQCNDTARCANADACTDLLINQTAQAFQPGIDIHTFVIGVPGSERGRTVLSKVAKAGGTAAADCNPDVGNCHLDVTREPDLAMGLQNAFQRIAGETLTCELDLPKPESGVVDLSLVNVVFTPHDAAAKIIPNDQKPCDNGADGWQYDATQRQIRLCGRTCTTVRSDRGGRIDVVLGCPVVVPD